MRLGRLLPVAVSAFLLAPASALLRAAEYLGDCNELGQGSVEAAKSASVTVKLHNTGDTRRGVRLARPTW